MTPQETALVTTLLERLKATTGQPKDSEAEAQIRGTTAEQPDVANYLAQTVLIHDLSLHNAQNRITELEKNLAEAKTAASPPTSFLAGLLDTYQPAPSPPNPCRVTQQRLRGQRSLLRPETWRWRPRMPEAQPEWGPVTFCGPRQRPRP